MEAMRKYRQEMKNRWLLEKVNKKAQLVMQEEAEERERKEKEKELESQCGDIQQIARARERREEEAEVRERKRKEKGKEAEPRYTQQSMFSPSCGLCHGL